MKASVHSSMDFTVCLVVLGLASMPPFSLICNVLPEQMSDNSVDPFNKRARLMYCKFRIFSLINLGTWAVMSSPPHLISSISGVSKELFVRLRPWKKVSKWIIPEGEILLPSAPPFSAESTVAKFIMSAVSSKFCLLLPWSLSSVSLGRFFCVFPLPLPGIIIAQTRMQIDFFRNWKPCAYSFSRILEKEAASNCNSVYPSQNDLHLIDNRLGEFQRFPDTINSISKWQRFPDTITSFSKGQENQFNVKQCLCLYGAW